MTTTKKIVIGVSLIGVAVGTFFLAKWLTKNIKRVKGGVIKIQTFEEKPQPIEFEED